jgi:hypothetical protein
VLRRRSPVSLRAGVSGAGGRPFARRSPILRSIRLRFSLRRLCLRLSLKFTPRYGRTLPCYCVTAGRRRHGLFLRPSYAPRGTRPFHSSFFSKLRWRVPAGTSRSGVGILLQPKHDEFTIAHSRLQKVTKAEGPVRRTAANRKPVPMKHGRQPPSVEKGYQKRGGRSHGQSEASLAGGRNPECMRGEAWDIFALPVELKLVGKANIS